VVVAQFTDAAHVPEVFGPWQTYERAQAQMERWERRIVRRMGSLDGIAMSVEEMREKTTAEFAERFMSRTGWNIMRPVGR
jgi:hypothetical protein